MPLIGPEQVFFLSLTVIKNHNKYLLTKFIDSEIEIGETIWWICYKLKKCSNQFPIPNNATWIRFHSPTNFSHELTSYLDCNLCVAISELGPRLNYTVAVFLWYCPTMMIPFCLIKHLHVTISRVLVFVICNLKIILIYKSYQSPGAKIVLIFFGPNLAISTIVSR